MIAPGEVVALLGPNGAGKSTTVDMLNGLTKPDSGVVEVFGREAKERDRRGDGVEDFADRRCTKLSGGQRQRVRFAVALVANPDLLVLDEPTAAMDVGTRREFWASTREFTDAGRTVLFATHYLDEAEEFADRVVLMRDGQIVADGQRGQSPRDGVRTHDQRGPAWRPGGRAQSVARVTIERDAGWQRQLRLTPLTGAGYLMGKGIVGMVVALPAIVLVPLVGALGEGVRLDAGQWLQVTLGIWLAAIPFALLGLLLGQYGTAYSMQAITGVLAMFGGLWVPLDSLPSYWMSQVGGSTQSLLTCVLVLG